MYFPKNMTFQYFFFDTYPGYFLQSLPIAVLAGILFRFIWLWKKEMPKAQKFWKSVFVCYLCGLLCMLLFIDFIGVLWYWILYRSESGMEFCFFEWNYDFRPNPETYLRNPERIVNFLMYLPFGVLYPLATKRKSCWFRTVAAGFLCSVIIELLQPVIGRAFDIDDVILNTAGATVAAGVFFLFKKALSREKNCGDGE